MNVAYIEDMNIGYEMCFDTITTRAVLKDMLIQAVSKLNERERFVISHRFGLADGRMKTLEEVAELDKDNIVTRERIRQIENKALKLLRHPLRSRMLKDFLDD